MRKTVYIKLKFAKRLNTKSNSPTYQEYYIVEQLRNAAFVAVGPKYFRIDDELTPQDADALCDVAHYEVTINK